MASFGALTVQNGRNTVISAAAMLLAGAGIDRSAAGSFSIGGVNTTTLALVTGAASNGDITMTPDGTGGISGSTASGSSGINWTLVESPFTATVSAPASAVLSLQITDTLVLLSAGTPSDTGAVQIDGATGILNCTTTGGASMNLAAMGTGALVLTANAGGISATSGTSSVTIANSGNVVNSTGTSSMTVGGGSGNVTLQTAGGGGSSLTLTAASGNITANAGSGQITLSSTQATNGVNVTGDMTVGGNLGVTGTETVTGITTLNNALNMGANDSITFAAGTGGLNAGAATGDFTTSTGNFLASVAATKTITLTSTVANTGVTITNDAQVGGNLNVTGGAGNVWKTGGNPIAGGKLGTSNANSFLIETNATTIMTFGTDQSVTIAAPATNVTTLTVNGSTGSTASTAVINNTNGTGYNLFINQTSSGGGIHILNDGGTDSLFIEAQAGLRGLNISASSGSGDIVTITALASPQRNGQGINLTVNDNFGINAHNTSTNECLSVLNNNSPGSGNGPAARFIADGASPASYNAFCVSVQTGATAAESGLAIAAGTTGAGTTATYIQFYTGTGVAEGSITLTGGVTVLNSSDARLKTNVKPLLGALAKLKKALPKTYERIDGIGHTRVGHVAQEVHAAGFIDAVQPGDNGALQKPCKTCSTTGKITRRVALKKACDCKDPSACKKCKGKGAVSDGVEMREEGCSDCHGAGTVQKRWMLADHKLIPYLHAALLEIDAKLAKLIPGYAA